MRLQIPDTARTAQGVLLVFTALENAHGSMVVAFASPQSYMYVRTRYDGRPSSQ